jgi:hypothetical protein
MTDANSGQTPGSVNYGANSQKSKAPEPTEAPRVSGPVISGVAVERKEPLRKKFLQAYAGDSAQSVGQYLLMDVIVPGTKNIISDLVTQGINRLLYGGSRPVQNNIRSNVGGGYGKFFNGGANTQQSQQSQPVVRTAQPNHGFGEIVLQTRSDAEIVIDSLRELIEAYGNAKVANLYSLVGISGDFTNQSYGWTNLSRAGVIQIREGYLLDLPQPEVLK